MWDNLSTADIEQAKQQIKLKREQVLAKHAQEIRDLEAEEAEIEALDRLADEFARKFKAMTAAAPVAATAAAEPPTPENGHAAKRSSKPVQDDEPNHAQTNFDVFTRALAQH